jgi:hypothetical protein
VVKQGGPTIGQYYIDIEEKKKRREEEKINYIKDCHGPAPEIR